jgi:hypothetical protein
VNHETSSGLTKNEVMWGGRPDVRVQVSPGGYFESDRLHPGIWEVSYSSQAIGRLGPQIVELPAADRHEVVLQFPSMAVRGTVSEPDGAVVPSARITDLQGGGIALSQEDGSFHLGAAGPGTLRLQARVGDRSSEVVSVEVRPAREPEPVHLVVENRRDDAVLVQVLDSEARPAAGALVFVEEESKGLRLLTSDSSGRVEVVIHPPYPERIRAAAIADGLWQFGEWMGLEAARSGMALSVGRTGSLVVMAEEAESVLDIVSQGWNISALLIRLGRRTVAGPGRPLHLEGLPPGNYELLTSSERHSVRVKRGSVAEVSLAS